MDKRNIIEVLNNIGIMLELKGESFFKSKAYYDAARTLEFLEEDIGTLVNEGRLGQIKGFGDALVKKITELVTSGSLGYYEELKRSIPQGLLEMLRIPGLGPKKVKAIYDILDVTSIGELKYACLENRLLKLPGFGEKTQARVLEGIENLGRYAGQYLFPYAYSMAKQLLKSLMESGLAIRCSEGGSIRRRKEIVKDIDILASSDRSVELIELFTKHPLASQVIASGDMKSSITLEGGINADLRVVTDAEYPYALHHFTGSKEHNTVMRHMAKRKGIKMNEYGLFRDDELVVCGSEEEIFGVFGMAYIPPELRENNGEIQAAQQGEIPELIVSGDIKGILHCHSRYSDGANSIEEIVRYCISRGYSYVGITDHSQGAYYAGGLRSDDIKRQHEEIDRLRHIYRDFLVLKGSEVDILPDGGLDYGEDILSMFDFVIASVHSAFKLDEDKMTQRIISAIKNRHVTILGHPTGRLLLSREPYRVNMSEVIKAAAQEGVILEINANPHRLDLDWRLCKSAKEAGCRFAICPDAHVLSGVEDVEYGVNIARKGWLTARDVVNTAPAPEIKRILKSRTQFAQIGC